MSDNALSENSSIPDEDLISEINMTPLVDISLVLVIIFMIISPFVTHMLKPIQLPPSGKATLNEQNTIKVSIFADGVLAVGSVPVDWGQLEAVVKREIQTGTPPWALVRAATEVPHERVMKAVRLMKSAGVQRIAFAAQAKAGEQVIK